MKKRILLPVTIAIALIVLSAFVLVACVKDPPSVTGVYLKYAAEKISGSKDLGEVPYGTEFADIIDFTDYQMYAVLSDGSEAVVGEDKYSVKFTAANMSGYAPVTSMPAVPSSGDYEILFEHESHSVRLFFHVAKAEREDYSFNIPSADRSWDFDEAPPAFTVEYSPIATDAEVSFYGFPQAAYDALSDADKKIYWRYADSYGAVLFGDAPCAVTPGNYYVYAKIPASGDYYSTYTEIDDDKLCTVYKATLTYPNELLESLRGYYKYEGHIGAISCADIEIVATGVEGADDALYDRTGRAVKGSYGFAVPTAAVNSGSYDKLEVVFVLAPDESVNYTVKNDLSRRIFMPVSIESGTATKPLSVRAENAYYNGTGTDTGSGPYPYCPNDYGILKGDDYRIVFDGWDANLLEARLYAGETTTAQRLNCEVRSYVDGDSVKYYVTIPAEIGDYLLWIGLKDFINYDWAGGSDTSDNEPVEYVFSIFEKKTVAKPTVELYKGTASDTDGKAFAAYDGSGKYILFNGYADDAVVFTLNGEVAVPAESAFAGYTRQYAMAADFSGAAEVRIVPDEDYVWEDGTSEAVTLDFEIRKGQFFDFSGEYASVDPESDTALPESEKPVYAKLMERWFGSSGSNGKMASLGMVGYNAAVRFVCTENGVKEAEYSGTFYNKHGQSSAFYTFETSFVLASLAGAELRYSGNGNVSGKINIEDASGAPVNKIGEYDGIFFPATAIYLPQMISSDDISYSVNYDGGYTRIKMTGSSETIDGSGAFVRTECEVVMAFDADGNYVGHSFTNTEISGGNTLVYAVEFGLQA